MAGNLNPRHARFVDEYMIDGNGTQAAIRAGYSPKSAHAQASQILKQPTVMSEIARKQAPRFQAHEITPDRVLLELARIAFGDPRKLFNSDGSMKRIHEIADEDAPMLAHVEIKTYTNRKSRGEKNPGDAPHIVTKIKLWDKNAALDKLGRHLKLFADAGPTINLIEGEAAAVARAKMIEELQALARPRPLIEHDEGDKNEQVVRP